LERIGRKLAELDPADRSEGSERIRGRLLTLRSFYRAQLGIIDDAGESRALTDRRIGRSDALLARTRALLGMPSEGPVDWAAAREAFSALGATDRAWALADPD
jgi:hypothetical protein